MTAAPIKHSEQTLAEGRARLQAWLPAARARAHDGDDASPEYMSAAAKAQIPYLTEANLEAVLVYPGPLGGWHADVLLKRVPAGVANCLGTPSGAPSRTREEAEHHGRNALFFCVAAARTAGKREKVGPVFTLHGWSMPLFPEILASGTHLPPDRDGALARIEGLLSVLCPSGFDGADFKRWPRDDQALLLAALHRAALSGILFYPPRYHASPSGHADAASSSRPS